MPRYAVLCLVGATTTTEMTELSELYARGCIDALGGTEAFVFTVLHLSPGGVWRMPASLDAADIDAAERLDFAGAVAALSGRSFDIGLPQMFCHLGMTAGRALFDLLDLPFLGNSPVQMGLTADKAMARAVVSSAGLNVPEGRVVRPTELAAGELDDLPPFPIIVKPAASDNSAGLSLVDTGADLPRALQVAFDEGGDALVERFIPPGRELRCAVVERGGTLLCLPPEEYPVGGNRPVRTKTDKLSRDRDGTLSLAAKTADAAWIVATDDPVVPALQAAALEAYRALGCRHYGLFDFRVDDDGTPWFLEAGLYCSFSPQSVICVMAKAAGIDLPDLFRGLIDHCLGPQVRDTP